MENTRRDSSFRPGPRSTNDGHREGKQHFRSNPGFRGNRPRRGQGAHRGPQEKHKTTCSGCAGACEVPFKPTPGRTVYCRECFAKQRAA